MKALLAMILVLLIPSALVAQAADKHQATIDRGLAWLVTQQGSDGSWSADGHMPTAMTAFAGLALLADDHTLTRGKYAASLRRALDWFLRQKPADRKYHGLLGEDPSHPTSAGRYLPQHGVALSFLAKLYGEIENADDRAALRKRLIDAVAFSVQSQSGFGGWYYTSPLEGHNASENVATMLQLQGLLDARDAGIAVPKQTLQQAHRLLQHCTTEAGGISYSGRLDKERPVAGGRPTINAMALAAYLPRHGLGDETTRRWLKFCAAAPSLAPERLNANTDLLQHFYLSKVVFHLREDDWRSAFPDRKIPDHLSWVKYRKTMFDYLQREQAKDGSWPRHGWSLGPVFNTSLALNMLLYEKSYRPPLSR